MNAGNNIPQTLSAESGAKNDTFPQTRFKEAKTAFDPHACTYYPRLTDGEISQQSADQLPIFHINSVEFDGFKMQAEIFNLESEQEEHS